MLMRRVFFHVPGIPLAPECCKERKLVKCSKVELSNVLFVNSSNMIIVATCSIFWEFLSRITIISSNPSTETWRPISTGRLRGIFGEGQSWQSQREDNCLYADKSVYLERLLDIQPRNVFFHMTRPRRFGKSTFLKMADHFFKGDKSLFEGLHIYDRGNAVFFKKPHGGVPEELENETWIQCPVIYLDFRVMDNFRTVAKFEGLFIQRLRDIADSYGLDYNPERVPHITVSHLIAKLRLKFKMKVVVLVDEFDSPFQNALVKQKNHALAEQMRRFLDDLFGSIKSMIDELRLVLILGVSKLGFTSLQSGLNNQVDLTYKEEFAGAFGFTSKEIEDFLPEIARQFNLNSKKEIDEFVDKLRGEYDGYNFTFQYKDGKKMTVLNPVSTMKCLENKKFGCYWSETSSVDEVVRRLFFSKEPLTAFEHWKISLEDIRKKRNSALESIPLEILMLLYGYYTIEKYDDGTEEVVLNFPNNEIRTALQRKIDEYIPSNDDFLSEEHGWLYELKWHMETGRIEGTMNVLENIFRTSFSRTLQRGINEFSNTTRLIDMMKIAGIFCQESVEFTKPNSSTENAGDVDVMTLYLKKNFIMSIKYGHTAIFAVQQLIDYLQEYPTTFLQAIKEPDEAWFVGINFDSRTGGTLHGWIAILFKNGALCFDQCKASMPKLCDSLKKKNENLL